MPGPGLLQTCTGRLGGEPKKLFHQTEQERCCTENTRHVRADVLPTLQLQPRIFLAADILSKCGRAYPAEGQPCKGPGRPIAGGRDGPTRQPDDVRSTALSGTLGRRLQMSVTRSKADISDRNPVDFGAQDWYTRPHRACKKCLILLGFCESCGNPSRSASLFVHPPLFRTAKTLAKQRFRLARVCKFRSVYPAVYPAK
jgi:hypothetical protein